MRVIDLRSDTVTKPSHDMRQAMANAEVGDDVYGEDPTVSELEDKVASLLGCTKGLFVPSGTMGNQIALSLHTQPGDEVIIEDYGHSFAYETGGMAALAGVQAKNVTGTRGIMAVEDIEKAVNPIETHYASTRLLIVENTANRGGGTIYSIQHLKEIKTLTDKHGLKFHMDGARLWNAATASDTPLSAYGEIVDSISICLSKGLGAPVGSVLVGNEDFITRARRLRKMYGGGMRQAGILAAGALYAIENNLPKLPLDHQRLNRLAEALTAIPGLECTPDHHPTNIAYARITNGRSASEIVELLKGNGILVHAMGPFDIRFVTHLDLSDDDINETAERLKTIFS